MHNRPTVLSTLVPLGTLVALLATLGTSPTAAGPAMGRASERASHAPTRIAATQVKRIAIERWGPGALRKGRTDRTRETGAGVVIGRHPGRVGYDDPVGSVRRLPYDRGRWYSPWTRPGFGFDQLIASYNASTPIGTFVEISVRGVTSGGKRSSWDSLGRWAGHDVNFHRMSLGPQRDDVSRVAVDTLVTDPGVTLRSWQLRLTLMRRAGTAKTPTVTMLAAVASHLPSSSTTSRPGPGAGRDLAVPRYSQEIHAGEYPSYNGGGEAWCSPTSTSMALAFWNRGPTPQQYSWVHDGYAQPWVDYAARFTYAWGYDGTGDWPFNTAYAGRFGVDAFVTRLRSLREAELFIAAGIPLVASITFGRGELDGAPITSTSGHLLVIRGFTRSGNVIVNDPAGRDGGHVRHVYRRGQFENAWVDATGGVVYVIHPKRKPLPSPGQHRNW